MPYTFLNYHFMIFPKYYRSVLRDQTNLLYGLIEKRCTQIGCKPLAVNGSEDHIHIAIEGSPLIAPEDIADDIRSFTEDWIENSKSFPMFSGWEKNYVMWSLCGDQVENVIKDIRNQKLFHKTTTLGMELRSKGILL